MLTIEVEKQEKNTTVGFLGGGRKSVTNCFEGLGKKKNTRPTDRGIFKK